jgi:hypothetical protein
MARGYTVTTVALALGTSAKWVDNVLSHYPIPGVAQSKQGVSRRISLDAVFHLSVLNRLTERLRIPIEAAIEGARLLAAESRWAIDESLELSFQRAPALAQLHSRLEYAVESAPLPRRGRPAVKAKRGA